MITITFSIAAILGMSALGYFTYDWRKKALDFKVKFEATKDFADKAAVQILKHEAKTAELSTKIVELKNKNVSLEATIAKAAAPKMNANKPVQNQITDAVTSAPAKKRRGRKPRNNQQ
jgi:uncharacterized membrane-anchored protein YhcB (DUF1043 family)